MDEIEIGFGVEDVAPARRALFALAVEQADSEADWVLDRRAWLEALWGQLAALFGWQPGPWDDYVLSAAAMLPVDSEQSSDQSISSTGPPTSSR